MKAMPSRLKQIDIEIEACENALKNAFCKREADDLRRKISQLIQERRKEEV